MKQEYLSFFNLSELPFTKEIKTEDLISLPSVEKALKQAHMLIETRGIGIITGKSGTGKSCILRKLTSTLHKGLYKPLYICHSSVGVMEFYTHFANELGVEIVGRRAALFRSIKERIISLNKNNKIHPILIIDEADKLSTEVLGEIRLFTNFEYDSYNALTVILCGQDSLKAKFGLNILESLANSITVSIKVDSLSLEETQSYIEQRVSNAGNSSNLFTSNAKTLIHNASGGS
jgi:general secretion pathway protein A